jgi:hypothetical protein
MKIKNYIREGMLLTVLAVSMVACTDDFDEMNVRKGTLTAEQADQNTVGFAMAEAQHWGMRVWAQGNNLFAGEYSQFFALTHPNFASANFNGPASWPDLMLPGFYAGTGFGAPAQQLDLVLKQTAANNLKIENAVAKIWKVLLYQRQTDYFGPIIYSQFGNGKTTVPFDSQKDIYMDFFKLLDEANVDLAAANQSARAFGIGSGSHDLVYDGNITKYRKFLNSLRLRAAMRIVYADPAKAKAEAEKAVADPAGLITDNADNALSKVKTNNLEFENKLRRITYLTEFVMSATMASYMNGYQDPRIPIYTQPCCGRVSTATSGPFVGLRNGIPSAQRDRTVMDANNSYVGKRWLPPVDGGTNEPDIIMEAAEVFFLRAEGALRGWNMGAGTAMTFYNQGITSSLKFRVPGITDATIAAYVTSTNTPAKPLTKTGTPDAYNSPPVATIPVIYQAAGSFETQLEQIITQKWLALFPMNDAEAWAERRRTGYPRGYAIIESTNPDVAKDQLVRRIIYPTQFYSANKVETEKAVATLLGGPDKYSTRLWWDAKPLSAYPTPTN